MSTRAHARGSGTPRFQEKLLRTVFTWTSLDPPKKKTPVPLNAGSETAPPLPTSLIVRQTPASVRLLMLHPGFSLTGATCRLHRAVVQDDSPPPPFAAMSGSLRNTYSSNRTPVRLQVKVIDSEVIVLQHADLGNSSWVPRKALRQRPRSRTRGQRRVQTFSCHSQPAPS